MANHLANENSPYLLQHANNPVDWYPWGPEAIQQAVEQGKPIFLSIGYAACHWCHVMAHESFEDPETAELMNRGFINIKVDREERPDLDSIYMQAVVAMTGQGGWPMSVFLTPDLKPFYGGTYYPPVRRYNMPSFQEVLRGIERAWRTEREKVFSAGQEVIQVCREHLVSALPGAKKAGKGGPPVIEEAVMHLAQAYDWKFGGWGQAPKFPQPMVIELLIKQAALGNRLSLDMVRHVLDSMALGGMYDVVGGGFSRYSTDNYWRVPHFEKMLYDNALLARVYLHAYLVTRQATYLDICTRTLDFMQREMSSLSTLSADHSAGPGFFSSLDADSEGHEGKFYTWSLEEIRSALVDPAEALLVISAYGLTAAGNFEGKNVLQRVKDDTALAEAFGCTPGEIPVRLARAHQALLAQRDQRIRPATDDKVLTMWNALAVQAFAEAGRYLQRPDYLDMARQVADFLLTELHPNDRLLRAWRAGQARHNGLLEDYAALILALLAIYQADFDPYWFTSALELAGEMLTEFKDPQGGFFDTRLDQADLILRPKDLQDNATPSGGALAVTALLHLHAFTGKADFLESALPSLDAMRPVAARYPTGFAQWLEAIDLADHGLAELAIVGSQEHALTRAYLELAWSEYRPYLVVACSDYPPPSTIPEILQERPMLNDLPTAYLCRDFTCLAPVTDADGLRAQLKALLRKPD